MNQVILFGHLTRNPYMLYKNNKAFTTFTVEIPAVDKDDMHLTDFIDCIAVGENAENINAEYKKGSAIMIIGHYIKGYETLRNKGTKPNVAEVCVDCYDDSRNNLDMLKKDKLMINKTTFIGKVTEEPEIVKYKDTDELVVKCTIAVNNDSLTPTRRVKTVTYLTKGKNAEFAKNKIHKGQIVKMIGYLRFVAYDSYTTCTSDPFAYQQHILKSA